MEETVVAKWDYTAAEGNFHSSILNTVILHRL